MKQIYDFEEHNPPVLTEKILRKELERRTLRRQTILLRLAGMFSCLALVLFAFWVAERYLYLAVASCVISCVMLAGNGVISVVFYHVRGSSGWSEV